MVYWALHWPAPAVMPVASMQPQELTQADVVALSRLLGAATSTTAQATAVAAPQASRFQLIGVLARKGGSGSAVIAVDGKPAKSYKVGSTIEDGLILQSVAPKQAMLAASKDDTALYTLDLPADTQR